MPSEPPPKVKKKVTDYAGIAALITAIAGVLAMVWNQNEQASSSNRAHDSIFAVSQYRLIAAEKEVGELEKRVRTLELQLARLHGRRPPRATFRAPPEPPEEADEVSMAPDKGEAPKTPGKEAQKKVLVDKVKRGEVVKGAEIRHYVEQSQDALVVEDF